MVILEGGVEEELVEAEVEVEEGGEVETKHRLRAFANTPLLTAY